MSRAGSILHGLALVTILSLLGFGSSLYQGLPDMVPTHWGPSGDADAYHFRSVWTVFGPLLIAAGTFIVLLAMNRGLTRSTTGTAERRLYDLIFGFLNFHLAVIFGWISLAIWYDLELGPGFAVMAGLGGLALLVIIGLQLPALIEEQKARTNVHEPSRDPRYWVLGGIFYNNPDDPRSFVPKPPHMGIGSTMNLASLGGRLTLTGLLLLTLGTLALPFIL